MTKDQMREQIAAVQARRRWEVILSGGSGLSADEHRARLIGASDVPALLGVLPFRNARGPLDVFLDFYGLRPRPPQNERQEKGHALEPVIASFYARKTGYALFKTGTVAHPEHPWLTVHPDRIVKEPARVVQIKLVGWRVAHHWDNGVPAYVVAQVTAEMLACGIPRCDVVADIDDETRISPLELDREVGEIVLETVGRFWREHILTMRPPEQWGTEAQRDWLLQRFPRSRGLIGEPPPEVIEIVEEFRDLKKAETELDAKLEAAKQKIFAAIGDEKGFQTDDWKVQLRDVKGREKTDWREVEIRLERDLQIPNEKLRGLIQECTATGQPSRSLIFEETKQ